MEENKNLFLKAAMTYGLIMGIFWVIKYLFFIFSVTLSSHALSLVYTALTVVVPVFAYYMTKKYKDDLGGEISFFHAWRFGMMLYFFAAVIVSLEHFVFFQFIAPADFVADAVGQFTNVLKDQQVESQVIESLGNMNISPIHMAIQGIFNNVFYGILLSIPVAAIICKKSSANR